MNHRHEYRREGIYYYRDPYGIVVARKVKYRCASCDAKRFQWQHRVGTSGVWVVGRTRRLIYNTHMLADCTQHTVFITEGEKDADVATSHGYVAVSPPDGVALWDTELLKQLPHHYVYCIVADNDGPGLEHAERLREQLPRAYVVVPPRGKDLAEYCAEGGLPGDLLVHPTGIAAGLSGRFIGTRLRYEDPTFRPYDGPGHWVRTIDAMRCVPYRGLHPAERCLGCSALIMPGKLCYRCRAVDEAERR